MLGNTKLFLLFAFPAIFIWVSVVVIPFFYGLGITFTDWDGMSMDINFIGIANYREVFSDPTFITSLLKTVIFVIGSVVLSNLCFPIHHQSVHVIRPEPFPYCGRTV